jgi:cytochrome c peroxidase
MYKWRVILVLGFTIGLLYGFVGKKKLHPINFNLPDYVARQFHSPNFPSKDNPTSLEGFELGRKLFYDKRLSKSQTISCASCHNNTTAFSDTLRFSIGVNDSIGNRNSMSLVNIGWSSKYFWDGRAATLRDQIHEPIIDHREMATTWADVINFIKSDAIYPKEFRFVFGNDGISETTIKKALEQFVGNIYSFNSKYDAYFYKGEKDIFNEKEKLGFKLFNGKAQCGSCHNTVLLTNEQFLNNGLDFFPNLGLFNSTGNETDRGLMKVPTLRNVALTPPYMHDGRFKTLDEVVNFYNHRVNKNSINIDFRMAPFLKKNGLGLNDEEKEALIAFLHTLTDTTLQHNKLYTNPW